MNAAFFYYGGFRAGRAMLSSMLHAVLRTTPAFFDHTPLGRVRHLTTPLACRSLQRALLTPQASRGSHYRRAEDT